MSTYTAIVILGALIIVMALYLVYQTYELRKARRLNGILADEVSRQNQVFRTLDGRLESLHALARAGADQQEIERENHALEVASLRKQLKEALDDLEEYKDV